MTLTLAELAIHIPSSIELFEKYDFNYYQQGQQTFKEACIEKGLTISEIDLELSQLQSKVEHNHSLTLEDMSIGSLIDFINGQFHSNETEVLSQIHSRIQQLLHDKMCDRSIHKLLTKIEQKFSELMDKLIQHCDKEDKILFPYIRKLNDFSREKGSPSSPKTISIIKNPIRVLEAEHEQAALTLSEIKKAANNYSIPPNAPPLFKTLMENLRGFEKELHMHLHIENNILFPKLIALEEELTNKIK